MSKHCSLFGAGMWSLIVGPSLLLLPILFFQWQGIEKLVAHHTDTALAAEHGWAVAETYNRGRDVLLTGTAPNRAAADQALQIARQAEGVRTVNFVGDIAPSVARIAVRLTDQKLVLQGELDSQDSINHLITQAERQFGADNIRNELTVGDNVAGALDISNILAPLASIEEQAGLELVGDKLILRGAVKSDEARARISQLVQSQFSGKFVNELSVVAPPCQLSIARLLSASEIKFASGKATIDASSDELLAQIAAAVGECREAEFEVSGHTDATGSSTLNQQLSEERAQAVIARLVELGLDGEKFTARGAGSAEPVADNNTNAGRAANRRIEFRVTN